MNSTTSFKSHNAGDEQRPETNRSPSIRSIKRNDSPLPPLPKEAHDDLDSRDESKSINFQDNSNLSSSHSIKSSSSKPGRRPPPPSSMLISLELEDIKNKNISNNSKSSLNIDAPSSKFSSSEKTTFDSVSGSSSVYESSEPNESSSNFVKSSNPLGIQISKSNDPLPTTTTKSSSSEILQSPILEDNETYGTNDVKQERKLSTKSFSLKSRNLMNSLKRLPGKRLSSGNPAVINTATEGDFESLSKSPSQSSLSTRRRFSSASFTSLTKKESTSSPAKQPQFKFTREELGIMNCNNELLNELELVTTELASAVRRELSLENKLRGGSSPLSGRFLPNSESKDESVMERQLIKNQNEIADLQDKLNKERRLRFISEEHALLMENGITPSPLKLNYEKTEIYRQLLLKNDEVNQLQDRLDEYERKYNGGASNVSGISAPTYPKEIGLPPTSESSSSSNNDMLAGYNQLLNENTDLKFKLIPELEKNQGFRRKSQV